jgi:selenocysteine lyase/cysteine desulfurase
VAFTVKGHPSEEVARDLSLSAGVYVSHGDFYASTVVEDLGLAEEGLVRAGAACYTTDEEVDRLVRYVAELARS